MTRDREIPAGFDVDVVVEDHSARLVFSGEFDLAGLPAADAGLEQALASDADAVVIDLAGLSFIDSSGLRFVVSAKDRCDERQRSLTVRRGNDAVHRVFELTKLDSLLRFSER